MIENLTKEQLSAILDTIPFEMVVVDELACVLKQNKEKHATMVATFERAWRTMMR